MMNTDLPSAAHDVTFETFESVVDEHALVILDFWAAWCAPCKVFAPVFDQMSSHFPDIYFGKVNTEAAPDLAQAFQVRAIPTLMAFKNGDLVFEHAGLLPSAQFEALIARLRSDS